MIPWSAGPERRADTRDYGHIQTSLVAENLMLFDFLSHRSFTGFALG